MAHTRRELLLGGSALAMSGVAGCLDTIGRGSRNRSDDRWAYTSFFALSDFTRHVVGDVRPVENAVPTGQHGQQWEPQEDVLPDIVDSEVFVYLGVEGFQPWVDEAVGRVIDDHFEDVALIDAAANVELQEYDDRRLDGRDDAESVVHAVELRDRDTDERVAETDEGHWNGEPLSVPVSLPVSFDVGFEDADGDEIDPSESDATFDAWVETGDDVLAVDADGDQLEVSGVADADASVVLALRQDGGVVWESPALAVQIGEGGDGEPDESDETDRDYTHGEYDATFFSDPVLAQEAVRAIRDRLSEVDSSHTELYEESAAEYIEELEALHERYEDALADRERDHVVLAGHDSFQYLAERYDFEIHTPVGLTPGDPSDDEIAAAVDVVEEHDIEYVLWDYFDGPEVAETIVEEADTASDAVMVSPVESVAEEWREDGHGDYIGQMAEINLPAFRKALGAE